MTVTKIFLCEGRVIGMELFLRAIAIFAIVAAIGVSSCGCATMKNTKIPESFSELGYCSGCKRVMALDGISDNTACLCPNCDEEFVAKDAKYKFKRRCADLKNQKTAGGVLTAAMMAASVAGVMFGVPIPPPPVSEETFKPYELPQVVTCKKASPLDQALIQPASPELVPHGGIKAPAEEDEDLNVENDDIASGAE